MTYRIDRAGLYWAVFNSDNERVSGFMDRHGEAEDRLNKLNAEAAVKPRRCMCCRHEFKSEGPHNRLCGKCRHRDNTMDLSNGPSIERHANR